MSGEQLRGAPTAHSLDEVEDAFDSLSDEAMEALIAKASVLAFGTGVEGEDIFGDVVRATLEGKRLWPTEVPFDAFLVMTMKSVASNLRRKAVRVVPVDMSVDGHAVQEAHQRFSSDQEEQVIAAIRCKNLVNRVVDLFKDDEEVLSVIMGRVEGLSVDEICEFGNLTRSAYETVSKRVQRKLVEAIRSGAIQ